ncbi:hypothetical protein [Nonomuraea lactucae]|uniref:hypothetical protein n=1 Tax=Nonomuraea lactucae TaxID=2249762 RepID=UPI00308461B1
MAGALAKTGRGWQGVGVVKQLPRTVAEAIAAERAGHRLRYLYFWGHRPARDGGVGPGCLSQWWPVSFSEGGHVFGSAGTPS